VQNFLHLFFTDSCPAPQLFHYPGIYFLTKTGRPRSLSTSHSSPWQALLSLSYRRLLLIQCLLDVAV